MFEDGSQVRFLGTNLTSYALFGTPRANVQEQARRLSELGFTWCEFTIMTPPGLSLTYLEIGRGQPLGT